MHGAIAAGHPLTAEAGADVLRAGGTAVDAAIAAVLASFVTEPLLTGLGAGGYMMVAAPGEETTLLDFFVAAPGKGFDGERAPLDPLVLSFGDAVQAFNAGAASVGVYGCPAGIVEAHRRWGTVAITDLAAPAVRMARAGVTVNAQQAYLHDLLAPIVGLTQEARDHYWPLGRPPLEGETVTDVDLADGLERLAAEGAEPFYTGDIAHTVCSLLGGRGGAMTLEDLATYEPIEREPVRVSYRGREMDTNPPPSSGGILIAYALGLLERSEQHPPDAVTLAEVMERAEQERTEELIGGLYQDGFLERFMSSRLGSTTHISTMDRDGWACSVTCTNGACSGQSVPGTGIHLNNMMGEADLNPLGFFAHEPGRRLPSMMSPTMVLGSAGPEIALGSAGSARIRSAILQVIVNVVDRGMEAGEAVSAPRLHFSDDGIVYCEPGVEVVALEAAGRAVARFRGPNLYFGGCQAVVRDPETGVFSGAGDPRRGGRALTV